MNILKKKYIFAIFYGTILTIFTTYIILDTFVIKKVYMVEENTNNDVNDSVSSSVTNNIVTNNTYKDDNIEINITEYTKYDTKVYVADIIISSAKYLKTAFANNSYGKNIIEKTSIIASSKNAILAINGDFYGVQEKGYVLRNGVIYRKKVNSDKEDLVIYEDGSFEIIKESEVSLQELLSKGAYNVLSFGPSLIVNNKISVSENDEVKIAQASNPRTAIGIIDDLHYIYVVADGRSSESKGLSLYQLAEVMQGFGVKIAYNLDGGGSSTMYFNGRVVNNPTSDGKGFIERSVSDIVYIGY